MDESVVLKWFRQVEKPSFEELGEIGKAIFRKVDRDGAKLSVRHGQSSSECRELRCFVPRGYANSAPEESSIVTQSESNKSCTQRKFRSVPSAGLAARSETMTPGDWERKRCSQDRNQTKRERLMGFEPTTITLAT